jgi:glucose 1-dehydrogenase
MNLENQTAVVTGGAIRIGRAITLALARAGCNVFIHYGRSARPAQETRSEAQALGAQAEIFPADLSDPSDAQRVIPAARQRFGPVHILVNSAAVFQVGDLDRATREDWDTEFAINLRAPFLLSQAFARQVPADGEGKIVNIVDARIFRPGADHFAYRLTKSALAAMTVNLALDLAPRITVNAVAPGAILPPPGKDQDGLDRLARSRVPLRRSGTADAVAENVLHLLRQDFLTGQIIRLDGGEFL